jgi:hypothetical protein
MQNLNEITVHAVDLSEFGKNPAGLPVFRVVWAPTRLEKIWFRETKQVQDLLRYPNCEEWVLEKWMSGLDYAGTPAAWAEVQKKSPINLEYPTDGEYAECMRFPNNESVSMAKKAVELLVYGKTNITETERRLALQLREELKEKDLDTKTSDMIKDALDPQWSGKRVKLYDAVGNMIH